MAFQMISRNYLDVLMGQQLMHFFKIPLATLGTGCATVFPNDLALFMKDLKLLSLAISALKSDASSFE